MGKFLLGLLVGAVLAVMIGVIGAVAISSLKSKPATIADGSTLVLRLKGEVPERPPMDFDLPFLQGRPSMTVENVWAELRRAASDPRIKAVVFEPEGTQIGWAKMQEIRADLEKFRASGKPLYAYLKSPGAKEYYMATACQKIFMAPVDTLFLKGIRFELTYFKNTFDKIGVQMEVEHAGKYKDYGDQWTRSNMSAETREVMTALIDDLYGDLTGTIAKGRGKQAGEVKDLMDDGPFLAKEAKAKGLVDGLLYEDEAFSELKKVLKQDELKKATEKDYARVTDAGAGLGSGQKIAFVVGDGAITRGDSESEGADGIESEVFNKLLVKIGADSSIKGVIVRIDSPGGEVTASDEIWKQMNVLSKKKPLVISMSDAAASGGYYMAMSGDPIVAYPGTITGSIGVVFGKPVLKGLYDKLGITKDSISRGKFAGIDSDYQPLGDAGRKKLKAGIDSDYEDFVGKVAASRKKPFSEIEPLAQGRVWLGDQAKARGLVDEMGGIDRAIEVLKKKAGMPVTDKVSLTVYPARRNLLETLLKSSSENATDAALTRAGAGPLSQLWRDSRVRVLLRGGMMRMMPYRIEIR